ncbi:MAG: phosphate ABC transporter ATP-binding protein [Candidatus Eisenbacteria bacterium]|nr:phosphate ABC transporter ATP-binding protein [Candidatus Eisenbacteria bacterium]
MAASNAGRDEPRVKIAVRNLQIRFGDIQALKDVTLDVLRHEILSVIGPANSGKSSLLLALNRMVERVPHSQVSGQVLLDGRNIREISSVEELRRRIGMVFALPTPLPMSIRENLLFGPRMSRHLSRGETDRLVETSLRTAFLWDEVKDRLDTFAFHLSGGQQQRLCIARSLAVQPEVILFDEPCSGLDPISTAKVEEVMKELKRDHTLVLVTNNTKQAARVGDRTAFLLMGELIEVDRTEKIFTTPSERRTEEYVTGQFG